MEGENIKVVLSNPKLGTQSFYFICLLFFAYILESTEFYWYVLNPKKKVLDRLV